MNEGRVRQEIVPRVWLDAERALWFEEYGALVVADLHWGYAESQRARGRLFPDWGDEQIAARLDALLAAYAPATMLWLGDALHARPGRPAAEAYLGKIAGQTEVIVLRGNHDRDWAAATTLSHRLGPYLFHHGDRPMEAPSDVVEIIGHLHPALSLGDGAGLSLKLPALIQGPRRWILPAFSPWAAGVNWWGNLGEGETGWLVSPKRILRWR